MPARRCRVAVVSDSDGPQDSMQPERRRRWRPLSDRRLARTIGLGVVAVALALVWLVREFQLDVQELLGFLGVSVVFVAAFAVLPAAGFAILWLLKRVRGK